MESLKESLKEEASQSSTSEPSESPKKATKRSPKKPPAKKVTKDIPKPAAPRKSRAETKVQKTIFNSMVHYEISMLLQSVRNAPYGPVLAEIYDVYVSHKKADDDFLRRQKNRIVSEATAERDAFEAITMEWSTQFESAVKTRIDLLQTHAETGAGASEKSEEQRVKDQQDMDSGLNHVILKMLGQYQKKIKTSKQDLTGRLKKIEDQNYANHEKGLAEEELHLLNLFHRFIPSIQMSAPPMPRPIQAAAIAHPPLYLFQTAGNENIKPEQPRSSTKPEPEPKPKAVIANANANDDTDEDVDVEMDVKMEDENDTVSLSPLGIKKRRISDGGED